MGDILSSYGVEWLSLLGRWTHLVTGIAWIGASFYFIWLDNHLLPPADPKLEPEGVAGELWAVHGGGFYHSQKYALAPPQLPRTLHWFYWEAYSTFLSGAFLLVLLYYVQADIYLIDPRVAMMSRFTAVTIGVGVIIAAWVIYDALCRSPLARHGAALSAVLASLFSAAAYLLCHVFSGRGAYIEFGAMLGSIMAANVFFVIIPGQRDLVGAQRAGRTPDPRSAQRGKLRSVHNTYFTLPVLFTMISNHYPFTFGPAYNWLVLIALSAAGLLIRVYFVARHRRAADGSGTALWPMWAGLALLAATAAALAPRRSPPRSAAAPSSDLQTPQAQFAHAQDIIRARCVPCHAATPTQPGFAAAPNGARFDSPDLLLSHLTVIEPQVAARAMPIGNLTGMTDAERAQLLDWIHRGAPH